tara:strand:- start:95 stop:739 length:645 start_codon:yes stop_codon:yes gene_type:complete
VFCVECGNEIPNGVKFCPDCGASQIMKVEEKPAKAKPKKKAPKKGKRYYSKLSIPELKQILKEKKFPVGGVKGELIERLVDPNWREKQLISWSRRDDVKLEKKKKLERRQAYRDKYGLKPESNDDWITDKQVITLLGIPIVLFLSYYLYEEIFYYENTALGVQTVGICASLLTIIIVLFALANNESKIEAAGEAWLMLTVLGAIFAIILYLVIF